MLEAMVERIPFWRKVDIYLLLLIAGLLLIGTSYLYSATLETSDSPMEIVKKQGIWIGLGLVSLVSVALISNKTLNLMSYPFYGFALFLLLMVMFVGKETLGAQRWISLGGFTLQPSEIAKFAFQLYVAEVTFQKYAGVYGTLGLVPIVLIWVYYVWLVVLLGAEVAHAAQNLHHLERLDGGRTLPLERELADKVNGTVAARLLVAVVAEFQRGGKGLTRAALASRFDVGEIVVERIFRRLKEHGLVLEVEGDAEGYLPARPPAAITLADVLLAFRGADIVAASPTGERTRLDLALGEVDDRQRERAHGVTFEDLAGGA